jgi:peptide/nickel transport system substrate-binding protein
MGYCKSLLIFVVILLGCNILHEDNSVIFGIEDFPHGIDPAKYSGIYDVRLYTQVYETLISLDKDYKTLIPCLARSWSVSEDNTRFTFELRKSVYFHNGELLKASDVKFSIVRQIEKNNTCHIARFINSVNIIDSLTIEIYLKFPYYQFLYSLTSPNNLVIISENAAKQTESEFVQNLVGTGPYQITKWKTNEEIKLSSFDRYWQGKNEIDNVVLRKIEDKSAIEKAIEDDEVDILYMVSSHLTDRLKWKGTIKYDVQQPSSVTFIGFNCKNKPLNDIKVRMAILKSLNLPKIVLNLSRGSSVLAKGPLPPGFFSYKNICQEDHNIIEARELLKEAGYKNGLRIKFYFPMVGFTRQTIIEMLEYELEKVGIYLDVKLFGSWDEHDREIKSDSAQMFIDSYDSDILGDAHYFLYSLFHSKSFVNSLHYKDAQVDRWLDMACREGDENSRYLLYNNVVKKVLADLPAIFLFHVKPHYAYNRHKIKRLVVDPYQNIQFHRIVLNE